mmetsp:Transcript_14234/g.20233  ORF Transcript_14234/g.20233 Transcript_14234/m.20233 type:complete len:204 (+) Transcript_14234:460-1071(+)
MLFFFSSLPWCCSKDPTKRPMSCSKSLALKSELLPSVAGTPHLSRSLSTFCWSAEEKAGLSKLTRHSFAPLCTTTLSRFANRSLSTNSHTSRVRRVASAKATPTSLSFVEVLLSLIAMTAQDSVISSPANRVSSNSWMLPGEAFLVTCQELSVSLRVQSSTFSMWDAFLTRMCFRMVVTFCGRRVTPAILLSSLPWYLMTSRV